MHLMVNKLSVVVVTLASQKLILISCSGYSVTAMRPSGRVTGFAPLQIIRTPTRVPISVPSTCYTGRARMSFKQTCRKK